MFKTYSKFQNLKQTVFHILKINDNYLFSYLDSFRCDLRKTSKTCVLFLVLIWKHWTESTIFFPFSGFEYFHNFIPWHFVISKHHSPAHKTEQFDVRIRTEISEVNCEAKQNHNKRNNLKFNSRNLSVTSSDEVITTDCSSIDAKYQ